VAGGCCQARSCESEATSGYLLGLANSHEPAGKIAARNPPTWDRHVGLPPRRPCRQPFGHWLTPVDVHGAFIGHEAAYTFILAGDSHPNIAGYAAMAVQMDAASVPEPSGALPLATALIALGCFRIKATPKQVADVLRGEPSPEFPVERLARNRGVTGSCQRRPGDSCARGFSERNGTGTDGLDGASQKPNDLMEPFAEPGSFQGLVTEHYDVTPGPDPVWAAYESQKDPARLAAEHAAFFRITFGPTLASALDGQQNRVGDVLRCA
jgi:hypothetical protein